MRALDEAIHLSIVMPFYHKLADFTRVLPLNVRYFANERREVVLVLDEPSEQDGLLRLISKFPKIKWRVLVNRKPHGWRPPCRAINVGIRHAMGKYALICSPESAFAADVPKVLETIWAKDSRACVIGQVRFVTYALLKRHGGDPARAFRECNKPKVPYGSLALPKAALERIGGYDESFKIWGGDDDNVRVRLMKGGADIYECEELWMLHLSTQPREKDTFRKWHPLSMATYRRRFDPQEVKANGSRWGRAFDFVATDWASDTT